jgi:hypothetical protein
MAITTGTANSLLDLLFGQTAFSNFSTLYCGLSTSVIQNDGSGATEPTTGAYARVAITNNKTNFANAAAAALTNATTITFPESTASWGTITYFFLASGATTGVADIKYFEALPSAKTVQSNTTVLFSIGALTISMTNT